MNGRGPERGVVAEHPVGVFNIELTNRCPMRCVMCPRTTSMQRGQGVMDFGLFRRVVDELVRVNPAYIRGHPVWLHHFGESLLHPEVGAFLGYAVERGIHACLSLNPLLLTETIAERVLGARPRLLYVSLDGHDEESFARIRGVRNAYRTSRRRFLRFLEIKQRMGVDTEVVLSMIDFGLNRASIEIARSHWERVEGVDRFLVKAFTRWDGSAAAVNALSPAAVEDARQTRAAPVACAFPWERMTVLWDGTVVPCCNDYDGKLPLGDLREATLEEVWNGPRMRALRGEFLGNVVRNPLCRECDKLRLPRHRWSW